MSWVRVGHACAFSQRVPVFYVWQCGRRLCSQAIPGDRPDLEHALSFCLSRKAPFAAPPSSLPHPGEGVHGRPGEQASEAPSVEILHRETGDKVYGERLCTTDRLRSSSSLLICFLFIRLGDMKLSP
jgi:hypothetical protein